VSSWDKYKKEVLSGTLDWSPMHTSEVFWRNNVDKFEDKDFQLLRVLLKLLETNRDPRTQVGAGVAAAQLGCWQRHAVLCVVGRNKTNSCRIYGCCWKPFDTPLSCRR
jgi:hypothetical protein